MKYTKEHEWLRVEGDLVVVGITEHAATQLGDVVFVELPEPGTQVAQGDEVVVIESVKAASDILAPMEGEIVAVNEALAATAALVNGIPAVTYDASGVHDTTLRNLGLDPAAAFARAEDGLVRRYNVAGDPLTAAQEDVWLLNNIPDAPGHEITLDDPLPPIEGPEWTWNPIEMAKRTADYLAAKAERVGDLHRQGTMIEALQEQRPWD